MSNAHTVESFRAIVIASLPADLRARFVVATKPGLVILDSKEIEAHRILPDLRQAETALDGLGFNAYRAGCRVEVLMTPKPVSEACEGCGAPHACACVCRDGACE